MTSDDKVRALTTLTAGLLASGHYTKENGAGVENDDPILRTFDSNDGDCDWKEEGLPRRHLSHAVADANRLLSEIIYYSNPKQ